jgi:hypothetical protein
VQCYSPATGQSLGLVNPVTPDGIDRIIAKAAKAQQTWAKTSFAERRQVLQSLLKYVSYTSERWTRCIDFKQVLVQQPRHNCASSVPRQWQDPSRRYLRRDLGYYREA